MCSQFSCKCDIKMERARLSLLLVFGCLTAVGLAQDEFPILKVGSVLTKPFLKENSAGEYEGFVKDLMDSIADKLNLSYEIVLAKDGKYGHVSTDTGKWNGMIGMAIDGEVDLIVADLTQTKARDEVLDFSTPFMTSSLTILSKKFSTFGTDSCFLTQPFSWQLWLFILVLFVATSIGFYITARVTPYEHWSEKLPAMTLCNTMWFLLSYGFKGSNFTPKTFSTRFLTFGWVLSSSVIFFCYVISLYGMVRSGNGAATMMAPNIDSLLANPDFKIGVFEFGSTNALLQKSNNPLHKRILARVQKFGSYINSNAEGVEKALESNGNFGVLMEGNAAEFAKLEHCELYTVGRLDDRHYALSFPKGSKYEKSLSNALIEVRETGKLHELINKWWNINSDCTETQQAFSYSNKDGPMVSFTQFTSEDFHWLFHTMFAVLAIALFISFIELAIFAATSGKRSDFKLTRHLKYVVIGGFVENDQDYRIANNQA